MKRLTITYDGNTLYDNDVDEIVWTDKADGVSIQGKLKGQGGSTATGRGLFDMLTSASRQKTEETIAVKRAALHDDSEDYEEIPVEVVAEA